MVPALVLDFVDRSRVRAFHKVDCVKAIGLVPVPFAGNGDALVVVRNKAPAPLPSGVREDVVSHRLTSMAVATMQTHLFSYRYEGSEWILEIKAADEADAKARLGRLAFASYDGVLVAKIPAAIGPLAIAATWIRNAATSLLPRF